MDATLLSLITGLGIGAVITSIAQHFIRKRELAYDSQRKELEARYRVVILLMYAASDFKGNEANLRINRPDLKTQKDVLEELVAEWHNMILFASSMTLDSLHAFIQTPSKANLLRAAYAMRKDLGRSSVKVDSIETTL